MGIDNGHRLIRTSDALLPNTCNAYGVMQKYRHLQVLIIFIGLLTPILSHGQEDWMNRGFTLLRSRQFSAAAEAFTRAIEMDPDNAEAYNHRGVARAYMGKIDDAISDYTRALQIKPELVGALNNRGSAYYQKKLLNQAISDYSKQKDDKSLDGFLKKVSLFTDIDGWNDKQDAVTFMTVHNAKGLEFSSVFLQMKLSISPISIWKILWD